MRKILVIALALCMGIMFMAPAIAADTAAPAAKPAKAELVDINSAAKEQITTLPGMAPELADKVIAGRPYKKKDQLKKIVGADVYKGIADKIIAKQPPKAK